MYDRSPLTLSISPRCAWEFSGVARLLHCCQWPLAEACTSRLYCVLSYQESSFRNPSDRSLYHIINCRRTLALDRTMAYLFGILTMKGVRERSVKYSTLVEAELLRAGLLWEWSISEEHKRTEPIKPLEQGTVNRRDRLQQSPLPFTIRYPGNTFKMLWHIAMKAARLHVRCAIGQVRAWWIHLSYFKIR